MINGDIPRTQGHVYKSHNTLSRDTLQHALTAMIGKLSLFYFLFNLGRPLSETLFFRGAQGRQYNN